MHHYINFVRKYRVVCVVPLPRHPTPPPLMAKGHRIITSSEHSAIRKCHLLPRCLLRIRCCAPTDQRSGAPYIIYNINLYPPATLARVPRGTLAPKLRALHR
nr:MAG TPA: hypothetical protein [Caudoviricetes sp.]